MHIELFLEEPSAEAFLQGLLPKLVPGGTTWNPIVFQGKTDLLGNLERRLKGYKSWMPEDWKIVVLIDEDRANCRELKARMEAASAAAGLADVVRGARRLRALSVVHELWQALAARLT